MSFEDEAIPTSPVERSDLQAKAWRMSWENLPEGRPPRFAGPFGGGSDAAGCAVDVSRRH